VPVFKHLYHRRLILVRRNNVEHLLMIGGTTDIVVEPNIAVAATATKSESKLSSPWFINRLPGAA
jgi:hypothetical protein